MLFVYVGIEVHDLIEYWFSRRKAIPWLLKCYEINSMVDFVITLGGDGTLLFASSLFPKTMPPVLSFHMGTLGFLTPFCANQFEEPLSRVSE